MTLSGRTGAAVIWSVVMLTPWSRKCAFQWIPSNDGLLGNQKASQLAKITTEQIIDAPFFGCYKAPKREMVKGMEENYWRLWRRGDWPGTAFATKSNRGDRIARLEIGQTQASPETEIFLWNVWSATVGTNHQYVRFVVLVPLHKHFTWNQRYYHNKSTEEAVG
jgi:hypothetical protein